MSETEKSENKVVEWKNKVIPLVVAVIAVIVVNVACLLYFFTKIEGINRNISKLEQANFTITGRTDLLERMVYILPDDRALVDLSEKSVQSIEDGFYVTNLSVQPHMSGVKITGEIINSQSLEYSGANLKIEIMGSEKSVYVKKLRPGFSSKFSVIMLDIDSKTVRLAKMWMGNYTVHWYQGN